MLDLGNGTPCRWMLDLVSGTSCRLISEIPGLDRC